MGVLEVGRWGRDVLTTDPSNMSFRVSGDDEVVNINGFIKDTSSLADALTLRDQLVGQVKSTRRIGLVDVHSDVDDTIDGFYILESASMNVERSLGSLIDKGFIPYQMSLRKLNTNLFESVVSGAKLGGYTNGDPFVAPPTGMEVVNPESSLVSGSTYFNNVARPVEPVADSDTSMQVLYNINAPGSALPIAPSWYCSPRLFAGGAVTFKLDGKVVSGLTTYHNKTTSFSGVTGDPLEDDDWELSNGIIRIVGAADTTAVFAIELYEGTGNGWTSSEEFGLTSTATTVITHQPWEYLTVLRNDYEAVTVRFVNRHEIGGLSIAKRRILDLNLRRGSRFATLRSQLHVTSSNGGLEHATGSAATDPSGSEPNFIERSTNDASGNRWAMGGGGTTDLVNGGLVQNAPYHVPFEGWIGYVLDGSSAITGDTSTNLDAQFSFPIHERVLPVVPGGVLV